MRALTGIEPRPRRHPSTQSRRFWLLYPPFFTPASACRSTTLPATTLSPFRLKITDQEQPMRKRIKENSSLKLLRFTPKRCRQRRAATSTPNTRKCKWPRRCSFTYFLFHSHADTYLERNASIQQDSMIKSLKAPRSSIAEAATIKPSHTSKC